MMRPLDRLVGEQLTMNDRQYRIAGLNLAGPKLLVQAIALERPHERVELPVASVLKGLFGAAQNGP